MKNTEIFKEKENLNTHFNCLKESITADENGQICISDIEFCLTEFKAALYDFEKSLEQPKKSKNSKNTHFRAT